MNTSAINPPAPLAHPGRRTTGLILSGCAVMFLILQGGATWLSGILDPTWAALNVTALMLLTAAVCERLVFNLTLPQAFRALGFGPPTARAMLAAALIACIMLLFFPIFSFIADVPIRLQADWPWILVGAIALNGVAEETLFRGFVFGGLRRAGLSFGRAGTIAMAIFAAVHLLLFVQSPFMIALLSTLLALAAAFPMAYLFERGGNSVWAPALLHVVAHTIRLVDIPEPYVLPAVASWSVMQLSMPFLAFAFLKRLLTPPR